MAWNERVGSPQPPIAFRIGEIVIPDLKTHAEKWRIPEESAAQTQLGFVRSLAFSPDGSQLAVRRKSGLRFYSLEAGKSAPTLKASTSLNATPQDDDHSGPIRFLEFRYLPEGLVIRGYLRDPATDALKDSKHFSCDQPVLREVYLNTFENESPELANWGGFHNRPTGGVILPKGPFQTQPPRVQAVGPVFTGFAARYKLPVTTSPNAQRFALPDVRGAIHVYEVAQILAGKN